MWEGSLVAGMLRGDDGIRGVDEVSVRTKTVPVRMVET